MKFINKLINFINKILKLDVDIEKIKEQELSKINSDLSTLQSGDIIWAKRYSNEEEKNNIPEGHREGPFIIISNNEDGIYATQGTSVEPDKENKDIYFEVDKEKYNLYKETHFRLNGFKKIDENSFVRLMCHLKEEDEFKFYKQLKKIYHKVIMEINHEKINLPFQIGDVVIYDTKPFTIVDINNNELTLLSIENVKLKGKLEKEQLDRINYSKTLEVGKNKVKYRGTLSDKVLDRIIKKYNKHLNHINKQKTMQRGSLILKDKNRYYIFGEEGQEWMTFELKEKYSKNYQTLKVDDKTYFTSFEEVRLNKKDNLEIICLCKADEIDKIKLQRKRFRDDKKLQQQFNDTKNLRFNVGDIIESRFYKNKRFVIIKVCPKTYECLALQKIKLGIFDPVLLRKEDTKLSKNSSTDGIKWLERYPGFNMSRIGEQKVLDMIYDEQNKYLDEKEEITLKRGSVILKDNKYYYVYGIESENLMVFEISNLFMDSFETAEINSSLYYTEYRESLINKNDNYELIDNANEEEIELIKQKRKKYKEINKNKQKPKKNLEIKVGSTIKRNDDSTEEFVVSSIIGNVLVCTSNVDKGYSKTKKHYINKESIILVKNK